MSELKTLKDIKTDGFNGKLRLKAEAVKWIKAFRNPHSIGISYMDVKAGELVDIHTAIDEDFIKHFFNITEEDLK